MVVESGHKKARRVTGLVVPGWVWSGSGLCRLLVGASIESPADFAGVGELQGVLHSSLYNAGMWVVAV